MADPGDKSEFILELIDKVSGPAKKAAGAIWHVHERVESLFMLWRAVQYTRSGQLRADIETLGKTVRENVEVAAGKLAVGAVAAGAYGYALTKGVVSMGMFADASRRSFGALTGDVSKGEGAFTRAVDLAQDLGLEVHGTVDSYKQLLAMQFRMGEAESLIKVAADLRAVTGEAQATERALRAITQIKAKGRLQSEELVGQLAEAGVSTVLVYKELAKIYGKSTDEVRKMITAGAVDADTGIVAIKRAIMRKVHEHEEGEAAKGFAGGTLTGLWSQLQDAPSQFFLRVADAAKASIAELGPMVRDIVGTFRSFDVAQLKDFIGTMIQGARQAVAFAREFVLSFMRGTSKINAALAQFNVGDNWLKFARELGGLVAAGAAMAIRLFAKVASIFVYLNDHRWIVYLLVGFYALHKILVVAMMVTHAITLIGAGMWLWRTLSLGPLLLQFLTWVGSMMRLLWGVNAVRAAISFTVRFLFRQLVLVPLAIGGIISAVIAAAVLIIMYWDEIVAAAKMAWAAISESWGNVVRPFMELLGLIGDGKAWSEAGKKAGKAFLEGLWDFIWGTLLRPILLPAVVMREKQEEADINARKTKGLPPELKQYFEVDSDNGPRASTAPRATPTGAGHMMTSEGWKQAVEQMRLQAQGGNVEQKFEINVNVDHDKDHEDDPKEHGRKIAAGMEEQIRRTFGNLATGFGQ